MLSIYSQEKFFTVQAMLSQSQTDSAADLYLSWKVRGIVEGARQFPERRWLIQVRSKEDLADLKRLLSVKAQPKFRFC